VAYLGGLDVRGITRMGSFSVYACLGSSTLFPKGLGSLKQRLRLLLELQVGTRSLACLCASSLYRLYANDRPVGRSRVS